MFNLEFKEVIAGYTRIKDITGFSNKRLFEVKKDGNRFVMKIFSQEEKPEFEKQTQALENLQHPQIIKMIDKQIEVPVCQNQKAICCDILVTEFAENGNICQCLKNAFYCSEDVTRTLIKQTLQAIKYSLSKNYLHEPLKSYDLLLDEKYQIKLSGWSTVETVNKENLRKLVFSIGEMIVLLLTGNPAFNKHNQNDVLFKFINTKSIGKFWQALAKRIKEPIPKQLISLVEEIFLNEDLQVETILMNEWIQNNRILEQNEIQFFFKEKQKQLAQKQAKKSAKIAQQKRKFKQILQEMSDKTRSSKGDNFTENYTKCTLSTIDLPIKQATSESIPVKEKLSFVIAWLRRMFNEAGNSKNALVYPEDEVYLFKEKSNLEKDELLIELQFKYLPEENANLDEENTVELRIQFFKIDKENTFANVRVSQKNDSEQWNQFYLEKLKQLVETELIALNQSFEMSNDTGGPKVQQHHLSQELNA